eukprot:m.126828 g.126828  ORF g.126828 m.126828 type:complete len:114 (-) comp13844_c0_seq5:97-438(-)
MRECQVSKKLLANQNVTCNAQSSRLINNKSPSYLFLSFHLNSTVVFTYDTPVSHIHACSYSFVAGPHTCTSYTTSNIRIAKQVKCSAGGCWSGYATESKTHGKATHRFIAGCI